MKITKQTIKTWPPEQKKHISINSNTDLSTKKKHHCTFMLAGSLHWNKHTRGGKKGKKKIYIHINIQCIQVNK